MIYLKTLVKDGNYSVEIYNEAGVEVTSDFSVKSKLYRQDINKEYLFLLETDEKILSLNPDYFEKENFIYATIYIDGYLYKTFLKTPVTSNTVTQTYTILYRSHIPLVEISNPFLDRFNYFMPRWSTAYKNDISIFSKLTNPLFANLEKSFFKTATIVSDSRKNKETTTKVMRIQNTVGKVLDKDGNEKRFTYNKENSPITRVSLNDTYLSEQDFVSITAESFVEPIFFKRSSSKLYFTSPLNSTIKISGINTDGVFVEESFVFNTLVVKQSQYSYRKLQHFESTHNDSLITNYIDCSKQHLVEKPERLPIFIDESKEQQFPLLTLENDRLFTSFVKEAMFVYDGHSYGLGLDTTSIFVTDENDVISLNANGELSTGILRKNLEVDMPLLNNNNNNKYVFVSEVDYETKLVTFKINTTDLVPDFESSVIVLKVQTNKGTYYLDGMTNTFVKTPVNFFLDKINTLEFSLELDDLDFLSVIVEIEKAHFQASFRNDKVNLTPRFSNIDDLYFIDGKVFIKTQGLLKELQTYKDYYEIDLNGSYIFYEDDLKIYSLKGEKLDG